MCGLRVGVAALAGVLGGCADAVSTPEWCEPGDVELRLASDPVGWDGDLELNPAWRMDGGEPGQEMMLPTAVALDADVPMIALTEFLLGEIVVVSTAGEWIGRWGRRGRGPGELMLPAALAWQHDGGLIVFDPGNSKIVAFDDTGAYRAEQPLGAPFLAAIGGGGSWYRLDSDGDGGGVLLVQPGARFREEDESMRTLAVVRGRDGGAVVDTLASTRVAVATEPRMAPLAAAGWQRPVAAIMGDSVHAVAGDRPEYVVRVYRDDAPTHVICRDVAPLPFEGDEATGTEEEVPDFVRDVAAAAPEPPLPAAIGRLVYDEGGRLWVERTRARALSGIDAWAGRAAGVFDVYDADGAYLGEARMPDGVRFIGATDELVLGLASSELGVLSLVGYRPGW